MKDKESIILPPPPKKKRNRSKGPLDPYPNMTVKVKKERKKKNKVLKDVLDNKKNLITSDDLKDKMPSLVQKVTEKPIIWQPFTEPNEWHPKGPQIEFLEATEDEVLFAGGRGSGKSDCLMIDPLRFCSNKNFRGLLIRRTMPELRDLIGRARELYPQVYPGVKWREQEKMFVFPSGARIEFGYCDNIEDAERYRGQQYTWLGIDEISQFPTEEYYTKIAASVRTTDPDLPVYKRATTNPSGVGKGWVKRRFIDVGPPGQKIPVHFKTDFGDFVVTRKWIQSNIKDNPKLNNSPAYMAMLASLPEHLKEAWLYGGWDNSEGLAFPDFKHSIHVLKQFDIPKNWHRFRACDWGFQSMAVCLWFAIDPDNNLYVYRELATRLKTADVFARMVLQLEHGEHIKYGIIDGSAGDQRGISGPTVDEQMRNEGCHWRYADKSPGSRKAGKMLAHRYLQLQPETGRPKVFILDNCKELIDELSSLAVDKNDPEDVDSDMVDHAWDAFRYGLMSRPMWNGYDDMWTNNTAEDVIDPIFGF